MIKQSKHWLTGLLMAAMVLSLTGCASVSAPTGNNQSADSSSSATAVSHQRAQKKHAAAKTSKASQTSQSISSSVAAATSSSLDSAAIQSSDAAVQKAEPATSAAQTAVSQAAATVNDQVVDGLNQAAGLQPENGDQYMTSPTSDGSWQVDVRTSNGAGQDPNVSHLKGIYKYNPATGQYQQMDPMTGEFN